MNRAAFFKGLALGGAGAIAARVVPGEADGRPIAAYGPLHLYGHGHTVYPGAATARINQDTAAQWEAR